MIGMEQREKAPYDGHGAERGNFCSLSLRAPCGRNAAAGRVNTRGEGLTG